LEEIKGEVRNEKLVLESNPKQAKIKVCVCVFATSFWKFLQVLGVRKSNGEEDTARGKP